LPASVFSEGDVSCPISAVAFDVNGGGGGGDDAAVPAIPGANNSQTSDWAIDRYMTFKTGAFE
jgi:hypothetical protein